MSRIIYPETFMEQRMLFETIKTKVDGDGPTGELVAFLTAQGIDLSADNTAKNLAGTAETKRLLFIKQSENFKQLRDLHWDPIMGHLRSYFQYLKSLNKPNYMELGNWGAPVTTSGKINYPKELPPLVNIWDAFKTKYNSYAPSPTPLDGFLTKQNLNISDDNDEVDDAKEFHLKFTQAEKDSEEQTQERDNKWNPVVDHIHRIGDFLKKLYLNNDKGLGAYGFTVDASPRAPKLQTSKVLPADKVTVNAVVIGGTLTNIGSVDLHVYKGKTTAGNPTIVHPNEKFGTTKGYSTITVSNPDTLTAGTFTALRNR